MSGQRSNRILRISRRGYAEMYQLGLEDERAWELFRFLLREMGDDNTVRLDDATEMQFSDAELEGKAALLRGRGLVVALFPGVLRVQDALAAHTTRWQ